jgi:hypothetical protein
MYKYTVKTVVDFSIAIRDGHGFRNWSRFSPVFRGPLTDALAMWRVAMLYICETGYCVYC